MESFINLYLFFLIVLLQNHKDASTKDHGLFFLRAMVKSEYPPEKVSEILEKVVKEVKRATLIEKIPQKRYDKLF